MPPKSSVETQDRYRKKEYLKRQADGIFRHWEVSISRWRQVKTPEEVRQALDKAIELPSGWTVDDYEYALVKLNQHKADLDLSVDQIANDVDGYRTPGSSELMTTPDPKKWLTGKKNAIKNAKALATHLISALKLSSCNDSEQAAALMEAARFVGQSLVSNRDIHRSNATAICLASVGPQYDRPNWFPEQLAETISTQLHKNITLEIGRYLNKTGSSLDI